MRIALLYMLLFSSVCVYPMERSFNRLREGNVEELDKILCGANTVATLFCARLITKNIEIITSLAEARNIGLMESSRIINEFKKKLIASNICINLVLTQEQKTLLFLAFEHDDYETALELCKNPDLNLDKRISTRESIFDLVEHSSLPHTYWWKTLLNRTREFQQAAQQGRSSTLLQILYFSGLPDHPRQDAIENIVKTVHRECEQVIDGRYDADVAEFQSEAYERFHLTQIRSDLNQINKLLLRKDQALSELAHYQQATFSKKEKYKNLLSEEKAKRKKLKHELAPRLECNICRQIIENEMDRAIPGCGNCKTPSYHLNCLLRWSETLQGRFKCPLCAKPCNLLVWQWVDGS